MSARSRGVAGRVTLPRSTLATASRRAATASQSPTSRSCASASSSTFDRARTRRRRRVASPLSTRSRGRRDRVRHADARGASRARRPRPVLPPTRARAARAPSFACSRSRRGCRRSPAIASNAAARDRVGEQARRRASRRRARGSWTAYSSRSSSRRSTRGDARPRRAAPEPGRDGRAPASAPRGAARSDRVAQPVGVDVEPAGELHHVLVAHEVARVLGDDRRRRLGRPGPALERRRGRRRRAHGRCGTRGTAWRAVDRAAAAPRGRRATRRRDRDRRAGRPPRSGSRTAAPSRTSARPRPGPAASASYASTTLRARFLRIWKWSSASAVPQVATALGAPASANAITSV